MADTNLTTEDIRNVNEADHYAALARKEQALAAKAELDLAKAQREADNDAASNHRNYVYNFETQVRDTKAVRDTLDQWHRLDPEAPWTLIWNSPGGSVIDGVALLDHIVAHSIRGGGTHHITGITRGMAASMASVLSMAADHRIMGPESYLMLHKVSSIAGGSLDDLEDEVAFLRLLTARMEDVYCNRSDGKLSKAALRRRWARKDWWVPSDEALKFGLVDAIG